MSKRQALIQRRKRLDKSQEQVALEARIAVSTYRSYENGKRTPVVGRRVGLARVLDCTLEQLDADLNITLNRQVPEWLRHHVDLEQAAAELWAYEATTIHGLAQTPDYARAVDEADPVPKSNEAITARVETRMARQAMLTRSLDPLELSVILDESVLTRVAGSPTVMVNQLDHLIQLAERPNVCIQVLPLDSGVFVFGSFELFTKPDAEGPYMVCIVDRGGANYFDRLPEIEAHATLFRLLGDIASSPEESATLIQTAKENHRT